MTIQISLVASATRVEWWKRFYDSCTKNRINWEVIFVGDKKPVHCFPPNFKHIYATCKPAQCYQIGFWAAQGELVSWTADDADYNDPSLECPDSLDRAYNHWLEMEKRYHHDKKSIVAFRPVEDGADLWESNQFFFGWKETPMMAPFALIHRDYFLNKLGGYDRRFISGQSENDVVMRVYQDGGRLEVAQDAKLAVHHRQVHLRDANPKKKKNGKFREWYSFDRELLENFWVHGGYGQYDKARRNPLQRYIPRMRRSIVSKISKTRLVPFEPFENSVDVHHVTQSQ